MEYDFKDYIKWWGILVGVLVVFFIGCRVAAVGVVYLLPDSVVANYEGKDVRAGEVVDKEIINASSSWFSSSDTDYRIIIQFDYKILFQEKTGTKSISVDKETYLKANIGDWFDSRTLEITKSRPTGV